MDEMRDEESQPMVVQWRFNGDTHLMGWIYIYITNNVISGFVEK
jgi:hypothetical protein